MHASRRSFLKVTSVALLGFPALVRGLNLNSQLQIAACGAAGKGLSDINEIGSHPRAQYVGFCDVDSTRFEQAAKKFPNVPAFADYREMFAKLGDGFDAAIVSTPDHQHAIISLAAMRAGKHLYCQKPLAGTVWEVRQMTRQAEKSKVITQMGNQIHSATEYRTGVKLIRDGWIGKVKEVHSWQNKVGNFYTNLSGEIPEAAPAPENLNWDLWIGTAPMREFAPKIYHPMAWRDWHDFGGGVLGDFGCHIMDPVYTALELTAPLRLRAENDGLNPQTWPVGETVYYTFPGTALTKDKLLPLTWYDGGHKLPEELAAQVSTPEKKLPASGSIFVGEAGLVLLPHVGMPQLFPVENYADQEFEKVAGSSHYHAWVDGVIAGTKTSDGFHYAGPLAEAVALGNIASRVPGVTIEWDAAGLRIPNSPEADKLLTRAFRAGWEVTATE